MNPSTKKQIIKVIKRCQKSPAFFINNFCKVEHPKLRIIPFDLFSYQKKCLRAFMKHRYNIFKKTRQCFVAGSMVWTVSGPKPIEQVRIGDEVLTLDMNTGALTSALVEQTHDNGISNNLVEVRTKTGHRAITTADHEYHTSDGWVQASDLAPDSQITEVFDDRVKKGSLRSVKPIEDDRRVFDLTVPLYNNYVVDGAVVHNCGISTLTGAFALWYAMFFSNKKILIVSKRESDAKEYMRKNIKFVYNNLPIWMQEIWPYVSDNVLDIGFENGSFIRSLSSSPDTLRSNASSLNIIDEAAFIPKMDEMWCLAPDTLIATVDGLKPLVDVKVNDDVMAINGTNTCLATHSKSAIDVLRVTTTGGHNITAGLYHKFIDVDGQWVRVHDLQTKSRLKLSANWVQEKPFIPIYDILHDNSFDIAHLKNNQQIRVQCRCGVRKCLKAITLQKRHKSRTGEWLCASCAQDQPDVMLPAILDNDVAEMIGLYIGDGWCSHERPKRIHIHPATHETDIVNWLSKFWNNLSAKPYIHDANLAGTALDVRVNSAKLVRFFGECGLMEKIGAVFAVVPDMILHSGRSVYQAFLRGLFSADGTISDTPKLGDCRPSHSTASRKLAEQVQVMLLGLGICSNLQEYEEVESRFSDKPHYKTTIVDKISKSQFAKQIGFIQQNKQAIAERNLIDDCEPHYRRDVAIKKLEPCVIDVNDLTITGDHSYISNGFVSHNSSGAPTLQHGGSTIVISTTRGVGNWYWQAWTDAETGDNEFNPLLIDWWDMDWELPYVDELSGKKSVIAPCRGIRKCETAEDIDKYGPYWSPWLEEQYLGLAQKGEASKFRQEILAEFIGTGANVLDRVTLNIIKASVAIAREPEHIKEVTYANPITGDRTVLDFAGKLWMWEKPVVGKPADPITGEPAEEGHLYAIGVDTSTGEADDWDAVQVFDITEREQVAELKIKVLPKMFALMADYIGRWYNNAFMIVERTGIGQAVCSTLIDELMYPNLFRTRKKMAGVQKMKNQYSVVGFNTTAQSKPLLNRTLRDNLGDDGFTIRSSRLYKEALIYVYLNASKTGHEPGPGNSDDLVLATGLTLMGINEAIRADSKVLIPFNSLSHTQTIQETPYEHVMDGKTLVPIMRPIEEDTRLNVRDEIARFTAQIGGIPITSSGTPLIKVVNRRHQLKRDR